MKTRPGIFDPWRQEAQPVESTSPQRNARVVPQVDVTNDAPPQCVNFSGFRAGVHVWTPSAPDAGKVTATAKSTLVAAIVSLLAKEYAAPTFTAMGISLGSTTAGNYVTFGDGTPGGKKITVSVPADEPLRLQQHAVDAVALALRAVSQAHPVAHSFLVSLKIRPYIR